MPVASSSGNTDLVTAGIQLFNSCIYENAETPTKKMFIFQPVVRTQYQPFVGEMDGISTAFVNVCTEYGDAKLEDHFCSLDAWISVLSKAGLYANELNLVSREKIFDWGSGEFTTRSIFFVYRGIEIGDGTFALIPCKDKRLLAISDIGFGLERISWALNENSHYYDFLRPVDIKGTREMFDVLRTLALLALSGIKPGHKGAGFQFRSFANIIANKYILNSWETAFSFYLPYWKNFVQNAVSDYEAVRTIKCEVGRLLGIKMSKELKIPPIRADETLEEYFVRMVYNQGIHQDIIRKFIGT
ncbi:hypothetical protein HYW53_02575 [Candidatus Giovannonibacteria bacterium]|nr:hypothetical protein [Candidatus Giovannonibacteria bacterium]